MSARSRRKARPRSASPRRPLKAPLPNLVYEVLPVGRALYRSTYPNFELDLCTPCWFGFTAATARLYQNFEQPDVMEFLTTRPLRLLDMKNPVNIQQLGQLPQLSETLRTAFSLEAGQVRRLSIRPTDLALARELCKVLNADGWFHRDIRGKVLTQEEMAALNIWFYRAPEFFHDEVMLCDPSSGVRLERLIDDE